MIDSDKMSAVLSSETPVLVVLVLMMQKIDFTSLELCEHIFNNGRGLLVYLIFSRFSAIWFILNASV